MRTIKTFILRLLVDSDQPQVLRGMLNAVADGDLYSFTDEKSLLALIQHIVSAPSDFQGQPGSEGNCLEDNHHS